MRRSAARFSGDISESVIDQFLDPVLPAQQGEKTLQPFRETVQSVMRGNHRQVAKGSGEKDDVAAPYVAGGEEFLVPEVAAAEVVSVESALLEQALYGEESQHGARMTARVFRIEARLIQRQRAAHAKA